MLLNTADLMGAFGYLVAALLLDDGLLPSSSGTAVGDLLRGVLGCGAVVVLMAPLLWFLERRQGGVTMMWSLAAGGLRRLSRRRGRTA